MKQNILYFFIVVGLLSFVAVSCSREEEIPMDDSFALILQTAISSPATKAEVASETSLREDAVELLNVYFYGTFSGYASPAIKHYTLSSATDKTGATSWKVSSDWRADGFIAGNSYDVYVSANSKQVKTATTSNDKAVATGTLAYASASITDLAGLKSMIEFDYNPAEANGEGGHKPYWGAYDEDNLNPEWLDLHKKYIPAATFVVSTGNSQQKRYYANEKTFLMDGKTTFTAGSTEAIPLELVRAAAKVVVDVKFDDAFLTSLEAKHVTVSGAPAWRFYNFSFSTPVIDPSLITGAAVNYNKSIFVAGGIMMGNGSVDTDHLVYTGANKHFSFVTYTYPFSWTAGSASSEAPAIILALGYTDSTDPVNPVTTYQTYKIPVVDPEGGVLEIGRNKLYRVQATIASEGGELLTDAYKVRCNYDIIPWGDIPVNSEDIADVDHSDNDYFDVSTTSVTLRGDGLQSETITIIKPNKRNIKMKYLTLPNATAEDPFNTTGVTSSDYHEYSFAGDVAENSPAPYFFNYLGNKQNHFVSEKTVGSVVAGTDTYLQNRFTRSDRDLTIESCSLPNLSDKYMMIRVYLDVTDWESKGFYRDITIRHLSTTRISHVVGAWSSRISACSALPTSDPNYEPFSAAAGPYGPEEYRYTTGTVYSYDREVYNGWADDGTKAEAWEACTEDQYNSGKAGSFPSDFKFEDTTGSPSSYTSKNEEVYSHSFHNDVTEIHSGDKHAQHTGESNAHLQDGWYYWGVTPTVVSSTVDKAGKNNTSGKTNVESNYYSSLDDIYSGTYDYYTFSGRRSGGKNYGTFTFYSYTTRYRANNYILRTWSRKKFSHTALGYVLNSDHVPSSSDAFHNYRWVNFAEEGVGSSVTHIYRTHSRGNIAGNSSPYPAFRPKYYNGTYVFYMEANTSSGGHVTQGTQTSFNPRIFIVQSSSPSPAYVMGRPNIDENGLSQDQVFSPAFMIASQLGAITAIPTVGSYNKTTHGNSTVSSENEKSLWSAKHCATYLEVGTDGTYYKNWRLPTQEEISVIINLQSSSPNEDTSLNTVLNAGYYRALDGNEVRANQSLTTHAVRCVRDLTQAEIDALNN